MAEPLRIVHYLNQFFGGKGGEEKANLPIDVQEGALGPGRALSQVLGQRAAVVATIIGGDNFVTENTEQTIPAIRNALTELRPHVVLAGPAFDAGRYGLACGIVCKAAQEMGIHAITAMTPDNPGVMEFRKDILVLPTGDNPAEMQQILAHIAGIALKLASGEELGPAESEGYLPRGIRRPGLREKPASVRAVDMLVARMKGETFTTELPILLPERVPPALPIADLKSASLAMVTTGGLVPKGNPDRLVRGGAKEWFRYSLTGLHELGADDWECVHRGFFTNIVNQNPNYILPLNVMRELEDRGIFASIYPWFFSTSGVGTAVGDSRRMGAEMGRELKKANVEGCILVAT
jgi:betaine reductase